MTAGAEPSPFLFSSRYARDMSPPFWVAYAEAISSSMISDWDLTFSGCDVTLDGIASIGRPGPLLALRLARRFHMRKPRAASNATAAVEVHACQLEFDCV